MKGEAAAVCVSGVMEHLHGRQQACMKVDEHHGSKEPIYMMPPCSIHVYIDIAIDIGLIGL